MNNKHLLTSLFFLTFFSTINFAQTNPTVGFTVPDTVCVNSSIKITNTSVGASSYYWNFCSGNSGTTPVGTNMGNIGNSLNIPEYLDYGYENGNYYGFILNHVGLGLVRLNFGNSLLNTPTTTTLGTFGGIIPSTAEGIQLVNNNGTWVLIIDGGDPVYGDPSRILKVDLGTTLTNNSPTATDWGNIGNLNYPTKLYVYKVGTSWYGMTPNFWSSTLTSFSFGTNFNTTPTGTNLGNLGNMNEPSGLFPVNDNGTWRVFITSTANNSITRIDFGSALNNTPVNAVNLGNPNSVLDGPRDIMIINNCNQITGYVLNGNSDELIQLNFPNLTVAPSAISLNNIGNLSLPLCFSKIFRAGADLYSFVSNASNNTVTKFKFPGCTNSSIPSSTLQNPPAISYNSPGIYNITLTIDDSLPTQNTVCKQIVVVSPVLSFDNDTTICSGNSIQLIASGANTYNWTPATGLSNPNISNPIASPSTTTKYYFTGSIAGCTSKDSINVIVNPNCTICSGNWYQGFNNYTSFTSGDLSVTGNQITVEAMINMTSSSSGIDVISKHSGSSDANYLLRINWAEMTTTNGYVITPAVCNILPNKTYHIAMVYDGSYLKYYRDGFLMSEVACTGNLITNSYPLRIGNLAYGLGYPEGFVGYIDEVRIWNVARTQTELKQYMDKSLTNPTTQTGLLAYYTFDNLKNKQGNVAWDGYLEGTATIQNANPTCNSFVADSCGIMPPSLTVSNDTTICFGQLAHLNAYDSGALSYSWKPIAGLSNPAIANPVATPSSTTTYRVTSLYQDNNNLVVNGDFEQGDNGFYSDYQYQPPVNTIEGVYYVGTNSNVWNAGMNSCGDHTTGNGNMMMVNGSTTANAIIWSETITVAPNTNYAFSSWLQSLDIVNPAQLQFSINGNVIGNIFNANGNSCVWDRFYTTWNSGSASTATISIINKNTLVQGNDFGLDDIVFAKIDTLYDSIKVTVLPVPITIKDSVTGCGKVIYNGITYTISTIINQTIKNIKGCDSIYYQHQILVAGNNPVTKLNTALYGCKSVIYKGLSYTINTTVTDTIKGYSGCDSVIVQQPIIIYPSATLQKDTITNCGKIIYNGKTYTSNTTVNDTTKNIAGCDSIIHQLSIVVTGTAPVNIVLPVIEGCVSLTYNGINYIKNTILKDTVRTYQGCDSIIHSQPIIVYPSPSSLQDTISGCNKVILKGITYTSNTSMNDTIKNSIGCDSIIITHSVVVYTQNISATTGIPVTGCVKLIYKGNLYTSDTIITDTIRNMHGCDSVYQTIGIMIHSLPALSARDTTICSGTSATLTAFSNGTIQWVGYNSNPITVNPVNDSNYSVIASSNWGCTDTISVKVTVEHFSVSLFASLNPVNKGANLVLQTSSSIPYTIISWSSSPYSLFTNPTADVQNITADTTTLYKIEAISAIGCTDSASLTVVVIPLPNDILMIPNAFSPNGDGINDTWIIKGINSFPNSKVTVYDRNGQIVYYDYAVSGFNGYSNGHQVPSGTYYYIIKLNDTRYPYTYSGWLEVVR